MLTPTFSGQTVTMLYKQSRVRSEIRVQNCSHNSVLPCLGTFLGIPSTQFAIWIYSLWTKLSIVPESCLGSRWTSPFSLLGYPGTGNAEFSAALDLEGGGRQNRSGTDWAPDDQLAPQAKIKGVVRGRLQQSVYKAVLGIASAGDFWSLIPAWYRLHAMCRGSWEGAQDKVL